MLRAGGAAPLLWLHVMFHLEHGDHPDRPKGKGDTQECNNYRGVTILSVPGKVLARILLDRVRQKLITHQRHEQSSFTPKKSTVDRIVVLRGFTERLNIEALCRLFETV